MATNQGFVNWVCSEAINNWFLLHLFMAERRALFAFGEGSAHKTIYFPEAKAFHICLPPRSEQDRIVAKIEELFSDLDAGVAALERVKANLKRYRAAVLKAAVEGRLTEEWRMQNPPTETGEQLLKRILAERRAKWEAEQLRKFAEKGKEPGKGWREKYEEAKAPSVTGLPALPLTWAFATVNQLVVEGLCNGISVKGSDQPPGVAALKLNAMTGSGFDYSAIRYIPIDAETAEANAVREGDFFVSRGNGSLHLLARGTVAQAPPGAVVFPDTMIRVRLADPLVQSNWVAVTWPSRGVRVQIERLAKTTAGIYKVSQGDLASVVIPLPPPAEQSAIVAEVDRRLSVADSAEKQVEAALQRAARLRQAILKRAFEGKLVPQDSAEELSDTMLDRIKAPSKCKHSTPAEAATRRSSARV
jgi:type I restriction enzyme S subunit